MFTPKVTRFVLLLLLLSALAACRTTEDATPTSPATGDTPAAPTPTAATGGYPAPSPTAESAGYPAPPATDVAAPYPAPTDQVAATATSATTPAAAFCPEVPRPAAILFVPGEKYVVVDPQSGQSCDLPFPVELPGILQVADEHLYFHSAEGNILTVTRLAPDGTVTPLPFTARDITQGNLYLAFLISDDGITIAWSYAGVSPDDSNMIVTEMWVADAATGQISAQVTESIPLDQGARSLVPVRFSPDNSTLFYTRQPVGIGGAWSSFVGRYDNLFSMPVAGGESTPIFDCAEVAELLCLGDFHLVEGQVGTLAYTDGEAGAIVVLSGQGETLNTLPVEANYVGYPTFSPSAELAFYSAELPEDDIFPTAATIHRVAPPTAPAEVSASDANMLLPQRFVNDTQLLVSYTAEDGSSGVAVVDLVDGSLQHLSEWPSAIVAGVLP
jgi:hypothetical protein